MAKTKELRENRQPSMFEDEKMPLRDKDWWKYLISLFLLIVYLFPFYIIINVSLRSFSDTTSRIRFPNPIYWDNFNKVIESGEIFTGIKNCLIITALVLLLEIVVGCMAAYALARNQSKLNEVVRSLIMSVMMITPLTILVGIYSTMSTIHATSTYWGMVLVQGVGVWNEYTYSYYFLQKTSMRTITLVIKTFFSAVSNDYGAAAATAVIGMMPLVIVYLCLQKYFIQGQVEGAVKG